MDQYLDKTRSPKERAEDLLSKMTLREKIGQLTQGLYGFRIYERKGNEVVLSEEFRQEVERYSGLGTLYGLYRADPWSGKDFESGLDGMLSVKAKNQVQAYVLEHSRLKIPVLMSTECPHGHQALDGYMLPVNLASGATFAPELLQAATEVAGAQLKDMGVDLALVSALDVLRDPRWGRSEECYSEDPLLASRMAQAAVRGIQSHGVDMVAKHMCAQGETTGGVNASGARIGPRELREIHLPPVKACVEAGTVGFMAAYNEIDGVFCHGNHWLLTDLLREEYGFEGFVMSDGGAIDQLNAVTGDTMRSGVLALESGVDMGLWDEGFSKLEQAVEQGLVSEKTIDQAALRILEIKFRRGLFEQPFVAENNHWQSYTIENYPQAEKLAEESPILLKNEGNLLPLSSDKPLRLFLTGPNADEIYNQMGDYTPPIRPETGITVRKGLETRLAGTQVTLTYAPGCPNFAVNEEMFTGAVEKSKDCDVIVAVLGGTSSRFTGGEFLENGALKNQNVASMDCGENVDTMTLELPGQQLELLKQLHATGKPVIAVIIGGRPYAMEQIEANSDAIFYSFYPGLTGGRAIAKLLFGDIAPAGRLPASLPDHVGQLPVYYNHKDSYNAMTYYDAGKPRYSFGAGLTYTEFDFQLVEAPTAEKREVRFTVTNRGTRTAKTVPQLYLHRTQGVVTNRIRSLCDFTKTELAPGETKELCLTISEEALTQWDSAMKPVVLPGGIQWFLGDCGKELLTGEFTLV